MNLQTKCLLCDRGSDIVPLIAIEYKGSSLRICSQHLPVLIHDPGQLTGLLPGAEGLTAADKKD